MSLLIFKEHTMTSLTYELINETDGLPVRFELICAPPTTIPAHWHKYVEILFLLSGSLTAVIQAETYKLSAGDILIINSEDIHMTQTLGEKTEYLLLQISASQLYHFFADFHLLHFTTLIPKETHQDNPGIYLQDMLSIFQKKEDGYAILFSARLHELIYCLYRHHSRWMTAGAHTLAHRNFSRIAATLEWIQNHYQEPLNLGEAADHLGFSRVYFCRLFKEYTGQTFLEYVNGVRAINLNEDLYRCDDSITAQMEKHGITNYKVFLHTFRKLYGDTPQRIRKSKDSKMLPYFESNCSGRRENRCKSRR